MAKKKARKPRGAAGIEVVGGTTDDLQHETNGDSPTWLETVTDPGAKGKKKAAKASRSEEVAVIDGTTDDLRYKTNGDSPSLTDSAAKPSPKIKKKADQQASSGHFAVSDIKRAAAFVNSIGGLDKAIALLQILKVAKEVQ